MGLIKIKKGWDIPVSGEPEQVISKSKEPKRIALIGYDYIGLKPKIEVSVGDKVKLGQLLFSDKTMPGVRYTSPGSGKVVSINRGKRRVFESIVIELQGSEEITFASFNKDRLKELDREKVKSLLIESGLWTALRSRPFSKVANPEIIPHSIFITAMDTNPLAPSIEKILQGSEESFNNGTAVITKLTGGQVFLCKSPGLDMPVENFPGLSVEEFSGPHPAGNVGTHIHFLDPVGLKKTVWHIHVQDVIAVGKLFTSGKIPVERIISLAGPAVKNPRLLKTRIGAAIADITAGELKQGEKRAVSGSLLSGRPASGTLAFLGRYHQQVSVLPEGGRREFLGWLKPGLNKFSLKNVFLAKLFRNKKFAFTTSVHGGERAVVPIGSYEKVMPLDILPTFLLRSLIVDDIEETEKLGCLELDEEDLSLCSFVCPSKIEYGPILRRNLSRIEKEML